MASSEDVTAAVRLLCTGGVVAFPTETVYGLGASASDGRAVDRIFEIKGRPRSRALIIHVDQVDALDAFCVDVPDYAWQLARHFWPGPVTVVCKRHTNVIDEVTGGGDTVALRMPNHPVALALIKELRETVGGSAGVAAPSANRFGDVPATTAEEVVQRLGEAGSEGGPDLILDGGACPSRTPSTIVQCVGGVPRLLRQGATPVEALQDVIGRWIDR